MKYLLMRKVYTDVGGIKYLYHDCLPVRKIVHVLQADNPWYNYYIWTDLVWNWASGFRRDVV